jgi:NADH dehydrogenase
MNGELDAVTGAFGYTGKYIARRLLALGKQVITLTDHPDRPNELGNRVPAHPYNFERPDRLAQSLRGVDTLYNTYWVRFDHGQATFARAIQNTRALIQAASQAGVRRIVHVSITNPTLDSPLPYFRGKALLEGALQESGLSYAIIRPTVIFGLEDVLINNIAYLLRRFPLFAVPGSGEYRLQPIYVEDMANLCVEYGYAQDNCIMDAVGPQIFTFNQLVRLVAEKIGRRAGLLHLPPSLALFLSQAIGFWLSDVLLTPDELAGLSADLLVSPHPPTGRTPLGDWLAANTDKVGQRYASELQRHY